MQNEVLGERYQLQEPIGRGGMATIYRGRDMRMERIVAVKVLREVYSTDPKFVTRFQREAKAASALQHPNIVQVYDYGQSDGNYFIVMELIEGADLRRYLRSRGVLAIDRAIIIAHDVALGLGAAHRRGIVHRDVKPQNVLVGRDGSIKLTDFGIASVYKDINAERLTTTGMTLGTVQYYAPEQAQGEIVSPAADVYALGIVMYEMLTGRTPFDGDTPVAVAMQHIQDAPIPPTQYNPNIPQVLEDIIMRCLEKVPEMRFRDGSTLARALEVLGEEEIGENLPSKLSSGGLKTAASASAFNTVPQRPANNGSRVHNNEPQPIALKGTSSPNNVMAPHTQNGQNGAVKEDIANGATIANSANSLNGFADAPPIPDQQTYLANGRGNSLPGFNQGGSMPGFEQQAPAPYYALSDASSTRPFQRGTVPRSGVVQQEQKESRFATVITVLILLATLLLLGFSIFLAGQLHFIPWFNSGDTNAQPTATVVPGSKTVPNLVGLSLDAATTKAKLDGFTLIIYGPKVGSLVETQDPPAGNTAKSGSPISVNMKSSATAVPTATIPDGLAGLSPTDAEKKLSSAGFNNYLLVNAGANPNGDLATSTVKGTDPVAGVSKTTDTQIKIFVYNCSTTVCSIGTPVVAPTTAPTATPTTPPKPTPTAVPPTPTPGVTPTAGTTPTPGVTPTAGTTPTPGNTPGH
ncbi:MAG: hypothetical protein PVS3B3_14320 [Ktedonobacteraceae bacterium]